MFKLLANRFVQGHRTVKYPKAEPVFPARYRGRPQLNVLSCARDCTACDSTCPTGALRRNPLGIDLGACLFCGACERSCAQGAIHFGSDYRLAATDRSHLRVEQELPRLAQALAPRLRRLLGRSLKLRQVSAGGCNACEADLNVLSTVGYDLGRFGIEFVASPRHADGLVLTGPVSRNMATALMDTYAAIPAPKLVIAVGACAISGGPFAGSPSVLVPELGELRVDLYVPGCPPHPYTTLDGLLRLLGRIESRTP